MDPADGNGQQETDSHANETGGIEIHTPARSNPGSIRQQSLRQANGRTNGKVDQPRNDDHGHPKGDHPLQGIAAENVHPVRPGQETIGAEGKANDQDDQKDLNDMVEQKDGNLFSIKGQRFGSDCFIILLISSHANFIQLIVFSFVRVYLIDNLSMAHDQDAMADFQQFFQFGGNKNGGNTFARLRPHDFKDLLFGIHIDPAGRFIIQHDFGAGIQPVPDNDFLLIAT